MTIKRIPYKLVLIVAGNLRNERFTKLFEDNMDILIPFLETNSLIELDLDKITIVL